VAVIPEESILPALTSGVEQSPLLPEKCSQVLFLAVNRFELS
jgi:hypothetical protein